MDTPLSLDPRRNASVVLSVSGATFESANFLATGEVGRSSIAIPPERLEDTSTQFGVELVAPLAGDVFIVAILALSGHLSETLRLRIDQDATTYTRDHMLGGVTTPFAVVVAWLDLQRGDVWWVVQPHIERPTELPYPPDVLRATHETLPYTVPETVPMAPPRPMAGGGPPRPKMPMAAPPAPPPEEPTSGGAGAMGADEPQATGIHEAVVGPPAGDVVRVWFGTNRCVDTDRKGQPRFRNRRDESVHYGWCDVDVPKSHRIGSLGSGLLRRLLSGEDDRLTIKELAVMVEEAYWQRLREAVADRAAGTRHPMVFIHGYNVSFTNAALRAAQIGADLQVPGPICFFSWPSKGWLLGYAADAAAIESSEGAIADYLVRVATDTGAERVDVIAHSMGNRGLLRAVQRILARADQRAGRMFGHFILAAPDVDRTVFTELAAMYSRVAKHTTLYISDRDKALWLSRLLYMYGRAGFAPPVTVVPDIDTVHVANVDLTLLGHGYVAEARDVLSDIHSVLTFDAAPAKRMGLRPATAEGGRPYWVISR